MGGDGKECGAVIVIDSAEAGCGLSAGHLGPHERLLYPGVDMGGRLTWEGDARRTCVACGESFPPSQILERASVSVCAACAQEVHWAGVRVGMAADAFAASAEDVSCPHEEGSWRREVWEAGFESGKLSPGEG